MKTDLFCSFIIIVAILLAGCASKSAKKPDTTLLRAAPSYLHWLQKQSMLAAAPALIAEVSQTGRAWLKGAEPRQANLLLTAAPNWLLINTEISEPVFAHSIAEIGHAAALGVGGLYLRAMGERPDIWLSKQGGSRHQNPASFDFDSHYGTEADFESLARSAEMNGLELGAALQPLATGQGPDFMLQARHASGYSGLYAMLPAPVNMALPPAAEEWDCRVLTDDSLLELSRADILPQKLARDSMPWASPGGWAATGLVNGADGQLRRWIYRFSENPNQPVLAWQDPSGNAAKALSAAVIRQTGLLGIALAGLHAEPLMGLEPAGDSLESLSPGIDALNDLARQIHRYGGWAMQADPLPASAIDAVLAGSCDFCRDDVSELLAMFGLLAADGRPLASLYRTWIGGKTQISRMARGLSGDFGVAVRILKDAPDRNDAAQRLAQLGAVIKPEMIASSMPNGMNLELVKLFLLSCRLGMPGLAFLTEADTGLDVNNLLLARKEYGLARGTVLNVVRGNGGGFGLLSGLPNGGYWLLACNFGQYPDELRVAIPEAVAHARDAATGRFLDDDLNGSQFRLPLDGRSVKI